MSIPPDDMVCRFLDPNPSRGHWSVDDEKPTHMAFRASHGKLSAWHIDKVEKSGCALDDLCIKALYGSGQAHLKSRDFGDALEGLGLDVFDPRMKWSPDDTGDDWEKWKEAHVSVESELGNKSFPRSYRMALAARCNYFNKAPVGIS